MTESERREQARQFIQKWHGKGREDEDDRSYWLDILQHILDMDTRRKGGMHYTSIENIHNAIDPLFLDGLKAEFAAIAAETGENATPKQYALAKKKLLAFQEKLSSLKFFEMKAPKLIQINYSSAAMPRGYIFGRRVHFAGRVHPGCFCA